MEKTWMHFEAMYTTAGAREVFEKAIETLLREAHKHSKSNVQQNAVSRGDGGIDVFVGNFGQEPIEVYQCKFFLYKLEGSQRKQISDSFDTAMSNNNCQVKSWTLCIPKVLTAEEHAWWASWKAREEEKRGLKGDFISLLTGNALIDMMKKEKVYDVIFQEVDSKKLDDIHNWAKEWRQLIEEVKQRLGEGKDINIILERKKVFSWHFSITIDEIPPVQLKVSVSPLFVKLFIDGKEVNSITSLFKYTHSMDFDFPGGILNSTCKVKVYLNMLWGTIMQVEIMIGSRPFPFN